ncbi:ABC transporter substrate-binding protein [Acidovorax sp. sic0104]|uniref:ABC transporter substrate-binding protein n=1 Tax=Acidovorax sp. sic0104 TaxID=2854784 RepID=UPI001C471C4B|nr:ABC transporter substrate-binding protein [Acidovorax sp. sic0104]MBV7540339.1 ABC transporter substrate-binding protein [Acidovorax sp. sic0104]
MHKSKRVHPFSAWAPRLRRTCAALGVALLACLPMAHAEVVELLHWWSSEGETRAVQSLVPQMARQGLELKMPPVPGGAQALDRVLRDRIASRSAPDAVQMKATDLAAWGAQGALASLDTVAKQEGWDYKIPRQIAAQVQYKGSYVAVPVNVHRVNSLYINRSLLQQVQGRAPQTWGQFFHLAERLQKAGITPLAHGNQPWQNLTLFETVALGAGGADFYLKALVQQDPSVIAGPVMQQVMQTFIALKPLTGHTGAADRQEWNVASERVIKGKAAMQIMGDWAKGEFIAAQRVPDKDFLCVPTPGGLSSYIYVVDSLAMFRKGGSPQATAGQSALARTVMGMEFQAKFNQAKGSIPITPGVDMSGFDSCSQESSAFFLAARLAKTLVPSIAHRMALPGPQHKALEALVDRLWNDPSFTPAQAQLSWTAEAKIAGAAEKR